MVFGGESYFESFGAPSPLRHTWSLGIEEQWYLVWPLVARSSWRGGAVQGAERSACCPRCSPRSRRSSWRCWRRVPSTHLGPTTARTLEPRACCWVRSSRSCCPLEATPATGGAVGGRPGVGGSGGRRRHGGRRRRQRPLDVPRRVRAGRWVSSLVQPPQCSRRVWCGRCCRSGRFRDRPRVLRAVPLALAGVRRALAVAHRAVGFVVVGASPRRHDGRSDRVLRRRRAADPRRPAASSTRPAFAVPAMAVGVHGRRGSGDRSRRHRRPRSPWRPSHRRRRRRSRALPRVLVVGDSVALTLATGIDPRVLGGRASVSSDALLGCGVVARHALRRSARPQGRRGLSGLADTLASRDRPRRPRRGHAADRRLGGLRRRDRRPADPVRRP